MSAKKINRFAKIQGWGGGVIAGDVLYMPPRNDVVSRKKDERAMRETYHREKKMNSYLADDQNFPSFKNQLANIGLELRDIPGDGALGDQFEGHVRNHFRHRLDVVKYMGEHKHDFEPFLSNDDSTFERHISNLKKLGTYAGNDAIVAFARLHQINVVIHQFNLPFLLIQGPNTCTPYTPQLHIAYHNGDHYSSVRKAGDNIECPTNIRLQLPRDNENRLKTQTKYPANHGDGTVWAVRDTITLAEEVMNATGCADQTLVLECLTDCDYDVDATTAYMLQTMETINGFQEDSTSLASQVTSTDSGIWVDNGASITHDATAQKAFNLSDNGISTNIFYRDSSLSYGSPGARPKVISIQTSSESGSKSQYGRLNGKQSKKVKKMEKKTVEQHKQKCFGVEPKVVDDGKVDLVTTVISKDLQVMRI